MNKTDAEVDDAIVAFVTQHQGADVGEIANALGLTHFDAWKRIAALVDRNRVRRARVGFDAPKAYMEASR